MLKTFLTKTIVLALALCFAIFSVVITTYAWFSQNELLVLDELSLEVNVDPYIMIRDAKNAESNFVKVLTSEELGELTRFTDYSQVTSLDGKNFYAADEYGIYPLMLDSNALPNAVENENYMELRIEVKCTNPNDGENQITLLPEFESTAKNYWLYSSAKDYEGNNLKAGEKIKVDILNAVRYSVEVSESSLGTSEALDTIIYEPYNSYNYGSYGLQEFRKQGKIITPEANLAMEYFNSTKNGGKKYREAWSNATNGFYDRIIVPSSFKQETVKQEIGGTGRVQEAIPLTKLIYNETAVVTIRFWYEGLDADSLNAILDSALGISLNFLTTSVKN